MKVLKELLRKFLKVKNCRKIKTIFVKNSKIFFKTFQKYQKNLEKLKIEKLKKPESPKNLKKASK